MTSDRPPDWYFPLPLVLGRTRNEVLARYGRWWRDAGWRNAPRPSPLQSPMAPHEVRALKVTAAAECLVSPALDPRNAVWRTDWLERIKRRPRLFARDGSRHGRLMDRLTLFVWRVDEMERLAIQELQIEHGDPDWDVEQIYRQAARKTGGPTSKEVMDWWEKEPEELTALLDKNETTMKDFPDPMLHVLLRLGQPFDEGEEIQGRLLKARTFYARSPDGQSAADRDYLGYPLDRQVHVAAGVWDEEPAVIKSVVAEFSTRFMSRFGPVVKAAGIPRVDLYGGLLTEALRALKRVGEKNEGGSASWHPLGLWDVDGKLD